MDELLKRARTELQPPWDDVREARVLARVVDQAVTPEPATWRLRWLGAGTALAVAAVAGFLLLRSEPTPHPPARMLASPRAGVAPTVAPHRAASSILALADGSKAELQAGAEMQALEQSPQLVRLSQSRGVVRYEVKPDAERPFSIAARGVEVRVIGTVFTVAVEDDAVLVSVERGRVAVKSGSRAVELSPGENVRLSTHESPAHKLGPEPVPPTPADPGKSPAEPAGSATISPAALMREADTARAKGDLAQAEQLLAKLLAQHPASPQSTSAAFSLGRVQRARGNFAAAARTFETLRRRAPAGPLAEDALAEAANAWALAGNAAQARQRATEYIASYPGGPHAERMRRLSAP